jgi:exonuclease VII small subunit
MNKHIFSAVFIISTSAAAELSHPTELGDNDLSDLASLVDAEAEARSALLDRYEQETEARLTVNDKRLWCIISNEINAIYQRQPDVVTEELLALDKLRSGLYTCPEMRFLARTNYILHKFSYESNRIPETDYKEKFSLMYRHVLNIGRLILEYHQIPETIMKLRACSPTFEFFDLLLWGLQFDVVSTGISYRENSLEEFEQTMQILEAESMPLSECKEIYSIGRLKYKIIASELQKLEREYSQDDDRKMAILKEMSELSVPREYRFIAKTGYTFLLHLHDQELLSPHDLKAQFMYRYRCHNELKDLMLEYEAVKDTPFIQNENAFLVDSLVNIFEVSKAEFLKCNQEYMTQNIVEYMQTISELPEIRSMISRLAAVNR